MRLAVLAACCTLLIFGVVNAAASVLLVLQWKRRPAVWLRRSSASLMFHRCLPALFSVALAGLAVLPSFLLHEPRDRVEPVSLPVAIGASLGLLILGAASARGAIAIGRTRGTVRRWLRSATPLDLPGWPGPAWLVDGDSAGVCVARFRQPVLLVSRSALSGCTARELAGVIAHERAHVAAGDNWKRLILRCLPDALAMTPLAVRFERVWEARTEEEADRAAVRGDRTLGVEIAGALVKLARRDPDFSLPLATAFDAGGPIERRIRLLLRTDAATTDEIRSSRLGPALALLAPAALCAGVPFLSYPAYRVVETLVAWLA